MFRATLRPHPARPAPPRTGRRRTMWFQREEPGAAAGSGGRAGEFSRAAEQGDAGGGGGAERGKDSSANQAFRR